MSYFRKVLCRGTTPSQLDIDPSRSCPDCGGSMWRLTCKRCPYKHYECASCRKEFIFRGEWLFELTGTSKILPRREVATGVLAANILGQTNDGKPFGVSRRAVKGTRK